MNNNLSGTQISGRVMTEKGERSCYQTMTILIARTIAEHHHIDIDAMTKGDALRLKTHLETAKTRDYQALQDCNEKIFQYSLVELGRHLDEGLRLLGDSPGDKFRIRTGKT